MCPNEPTKRQWPGSLTGQFVELRRLDAGRDAPDLYPLSHGSEEMESVWTYMGYGPFRDAGRMQEWMASLEERLQAPLKRQIADQIDPRLPLPTGQAW